LFGARLQAHQAGDDLEAVLDAVIALAEHHGIARCGLLGVRQQLPEAKVLAAQIASHRREILRTLAS
jgi:hypothetical protein